MLNFLKLGVEPLSGAPASCRGTGSSPSWALHHVGDPEAAVAAIWGVEGRLQSLKYTLKRKGPTEYYVYLLVLKI